MNGKKMTVALRSSSHTRINSQQVQHLHAGVSGPENILWAVASWKAKGVFWRGFC